MNRDLVERRPLLTVTLTYCLSSWQMAQVAGGWSPAAQAAWIKQIVPMLLAKPAVQGIAWQQAYDGKAAALPGSGLFDASGKPKPALAELAGLRSEHLI